jgi:hypothetical protein
MFGDRVASRPDQFETDRLTSIHNPDPYCSFPVLIETGGLRPFRVIASYRIATMPGRGSDSVTAQGQRGLHNTNDLCVCVPEVSPSLSQSDFLDSFFRVMSFRDKRG